MIGPMDQLIDGFLLELKESEEAFQREIDEVTESAESLVAAGQKIQRNALSRRLSVGDHWTRSSKDESRKRKITDGIDGWGDAVERELLQKRQAR